MSLEEACAHCYKCFVDANVLISEEIEYQQKEQEPRELPKAPNSYMLKYNLAPEEIDKRLEKNPEFRRMIVAQDDKVYRERIDAMRALNSLFLLGFQRARIKSALQACENCDYRNAGIIETVKNHQ